MVVIVQQKQLLKDLFITITLKTISSLEDGWKYLIQSGFYEVYFIIYHSLHFSFIIMINPIFILYSIFCRYSYIATRTNIYIHYTRFVGQNERLICTSGSRGAHPARAPLTAADLRFFMPKTLFFSQFFLRSRLILSIILIEIWQNTLKYDCYFNLQHFQ